MPGIPSEVIASRGGDAIDVNTALNNLFSYPLDKLKATRY